MAAKKSNRLIYFAKQYLELPLEVGKSSSVSITEYSRRHFIGFIGMFCTFAVLGCSSGDESEPQQSQLDAIDTALSSTRRSIEQILAEQTAIGEELASLKDVLDKQDSTIQNMTTQINQIHDTILPRLVDANSTLKVDPLNQIAQDSFQAAIEQLHNATEQLQKAADQLRAVSQQTSPPPAGSVQTSPSPAGSAQTVPIAASTAEECARAAALRVAFNVATAQLALTFMQQDTLRALQTLLRAQQRAIEAAMPLLERAVRATHDALIAASAALAGCIFIPSTCAVALVAVKSAIIAVLVAEAALTDAVVRLAAISVILNNIADRLSRLQQVANGQQQALNDIAIALGNAERACISGGQGRGW